MNDSFLIYHLQEILDWSDEYILVDDLNFYYKSWKDNQINRKYRMTADLLKQMKQSNLILITFISMITYNFHESKIIIDLIFIFLIIYDQLIYCQVITELDKASDHKLIETFFYFNVRMKEIIKHKSWKKTDAKAIKKISNML